ncbi:hypothetical protein D3C71_1413240 [compost metagenome]
MQRRRPGQAHGFLFRVDIKYPLLHFPQHGMVYIYICATFEIKGHAPIIARRHQPAIAFPIRLPAPAVAVQWFAGLVYRSPPVAGTIKIHRPFKITGDSLSIQVQVPGFFFSRAATQ